MKGRSILFSGEMVRAILDGRKTQTRRAIKPQPGDEWHPDPVGWYAPLMVDKHGEEYPGSEVYGASDEDEGRICPYGVPSDRLYVKEATWLWCERRPNGTTKTGRQKWHYVPVLNTPPVYVADHPTKPDWGYPVTTQSGNVQMWKYKTARFMPRWASRITLEIAEVRVQRVQEISEEDARAEGAMFHDGRGIGHSGWRFDIDHGFVYATSKTSFMKLWDSINAKRGSGWDKNPWVWALTFGRVQ